jgi:hypothetical protein
MEYPPLVQYSTEAEYRSHYENVYCCGPITTFDGIKVRFRKEQFDHCFFESSKRDGSKDQFSLLRAPVLTGLRQRWKTRRQSCIADGIKSGNAMTAATGWLLW